jgi:hypothetical protein
MIGPHPTNGRVRHGIACADAWLQSGQRSSISCVRSAGAWHHCAAAAEARAAKYRGSHYSCEGKERDGLTVDGRPESLSTEMASRARPRILRGPGRADLHHGQSECSGAGYITAGLLETNSHESTCRPGAGHAFGTHNPLGGTVSKPYA